MKSLIKTATATLLMALPMLLPLSVAAQEPVGKGSVFAPEPPSPDLIAPEDDLEVATDVDLFTDLGYVLPDFNVYFNLRHDVASSIVIPDYTKRTGKVPPEDTRLEVASVYLTGGDFNDIIVFSFLPGDCSLGCLAQIYRTADGLKWNKVLEFTAYAAVYKQAEGDKPAEVVAVGGTALKSRMFTWDGHGFVER